LGYDWAKGSSDRKTGELMERLSAGFFKLLDGLTIARSRRHVQKFYRASLAQLGGFSERLRPQSPQKTFTRRAGSLLQAGRDAMLPTRSQQITDQTEFELITWLVIGKMSSE